MRVAKRWGGLLALLLGLAGCTGTSTVQVKGRVLDQKGQPVAGAVVSDGKASTCTNEQGQFLLAAYSTRVTVHKTRYYPAEANGADVTITLSPKSGAVAVAWDQRSTQVKTEGVRAYLEQNGFRSLPFSSQLPSCEVLVLPCPSALASGASQELLRWVREGGALVLFGEWGGYPYFDDDGANQLLRETGIQFSGGTVNWFDPTDQERPEWLPVSTFTTASLSRNVKGLVLFTAGCLELKDPAVNLAQTSAGAYHINGFSRGSQVVAAYAPLGRGKVTVWADTSFISDTETRGSGSPDWKASDNAVVILNSLNW